MNKNRIAAWSVGALAFVVSVVLALVGICTLILKGVYAIMRRAREILQQTALRALAWVKRNCSIPRLLSLWVLGLLGFTVLVLGVCFTENSEPGRFIPRLEKKECPCCCRKDCWCSSCCRAVLLRKCVHELCRGQHGFLRECVPALGGLLRTQAAERGQSFCAEAVTRGHVGCQRREIRMIFLILRAALRRISG